MLYDDVFLLGDHSKFVSLVVPLSTTESVSAYIVSELLQYHNICIIILYILDYND